MNDTPKNKSTQEVLLNTIIKGMPYADRIEGIDLAEPNAVRFNWRDSCYRVFEYGGAPRCQVVFGGTLGTTDNTILISRILGLTWESMGMPEIGKE